MVAFLCRAARKLQTLDPMYLTPAESAERLKADYAKYASVVALSGARVE